MNEGGNCNGSTEPSFPLTQVDGRAGSLEQDAGGHSLTKASKKLMWSIHGAVISKLGFLGQISRINNHIKGHTWPAQVIPVESLQAKKWNMAFSLSYQPATPETYRTVGPRSLRDSSPSWHPWLSTSTHPTSTCWPREPNQASLLKHSSHLPGTLAVKIRYTGLERWLRG